jgi:VWFA-related protein
MPGIFLLWIGQKNAPDRIQFTGRLDSTSLSHGNFMLLSYPRSFFRLHIVAAAILIMLLQHALLRAQDATPPVFKVNTRIVVLDVVVTDKKGTVIKNLKRDDFTILEDKQKQAIRTFEPPSVHVMPPAPDGKAVVASAADLNKIGDAPVTLLVLDELNTQFTDMSYARRELEKYLNSQPEVLRQPTALFVASNTRFQLLHDYTQNRSDILTALKGHFPEYPWKLKQSGAAGPGAIERIAQSLSSLLQIAEATSGTPGRKNVIWVGVNAPSVNLVDADPVTIQQMNTLVKRTTQTLLANRVTVYYIDPTISDSSDSTTVSGESNDDTSLVDTDPFGSDINFNKFAPATGGKIFLLGNGIDQEIATTIDDGASYYTLSYSPSNKNEDPAKFRRISIKLSNSDLIAVTREGYYAEGTNANNSIADTTLTPNQRRKLLEQDLSQAAFSAIPYNGLAVTAQAPQKGADPHLWQISIAAKGLTWIPQSNGSLRAEVSEIEVALGSKNNILDHSANELQCNQRPGEASPDMVIFQVPVNIPGSAKHLRFVIRDAASGNVGTADVTP